MLSPSSIKNEFLEKWLKGLQVYNARKKEMGILERKKAIKLSADIAMASTRVSTSSWSRALMAKASNIDDTNKLLVENLLTPEAQKLLPFREVPEKSMPIIMSKTSCSKRIRSKKILKKSCCTRRNIMRKPKGSRRAMEASFVAKRMIMKRKQVLKSLIPGGEFMDNISLIRETLDYILSLRLQVDVMRVLANATEKTDHGKGYNN